MTTKLTTIADDMRTLVGQQPGWAQQTLTRGLRIIYQRTEDGRIRLACAREDAYPSDTEINLVRQAFHVPPAADEERSDHRWLNPKTNRPVTFHRVELKWMER
jgi:hypothetical protein